MKKLLTFNEDFTYFNAQLNTFALFIKEDYKVGKDLKGLGICLLILLPSLFICQHLKASEWIIIPLLILFVVALFLFVFIDTNRKNKLLKKKGLPYASFWKIHWETKSLCDRRIHMVYKIYKTVPKEVIEGRIRLAQKEIDQRNLNILFYFEKAYGFILKNYILTIITIIVVLYKQDPSK